MSYNLVNQIISFQPNKSHIYLAWSISCVFQPANGCSARRLLVEIINFLTEKDLKSYFSVKKMISTSERHAEHPSAGRNTQQVLVRFHPVRPRFYSLFSLSYIVQDFMNRQSLVNADKIK